MQSSFDYSQRLYSLDYNQLIAKDIPRIHANIQLLRNLIETPICIQLFYVL